MRLRSALVETFIVAAALLPATALAQGADLQCHKVKDANQFKGAILSLQARAAKFQATGNCELGGKALEYCTPVDTTVVNPGGAPVPADLPPTPDVVGSYLCYKMKCPKAAIANEDVTDKFGARTLGSIKESKRVCVPVAPSVTTPLPAWCTPGDPTLHVFAGTVTDASNPANAAGPGIPSRWEFQGEIGLAAGQAMCRSIGADHPCDYAEIVCAEANGELDNLLSLMPSSAPTFWIHRTTPVTVDGREYPAGAGGRCQDWTYTTNHIAAGEFGVVSSSSAGTGNTITPYFDMNTCFTGDPRDGCVGPTTEWNGKAPSPTGHGGHCGGAIPRAIMCCTTHL